MFGIIIVIILFPLILFAQSDDIQFEYLSVDEGLSNSYATCVTQDSSGFIWIGTANGLHKYDGYRFTTFKHIPFDTTGLSDNIIYALCVDQTGYLWIGTGTGGLNRYDPRTETFICFKHDPQNSQSLSSNNILALSQDKDANLWIGTADGGLNRSVYQQDSLNARNYIFEKLYHKPGNKNSIAGNTVNTIYEDSHGNIWVGTTNGLSRISKSHTNPMSIKNFRNNDLEPNSLSSNNISTICEDSEGKLWIGTRDGGVNRFSPEDEVFYRYYYEPGNQLSLSQNDISAIHTDRNNRDILWIGTLNGGINRLNIKSGKIRRFEAVSDFYLHLKNYVYDIYQDASGLFWIAAWAGGIIKFDPQRNKFTKFQPGFGSGTEDVIWSIYVNPNSKEPFIWLISAGGGVLKFDKTKKTYKRYLTDLSHPDYKARNVLINLYGEPKKNNPTQSILWLGSLAEGIIQFDCEKEQFKYFNDDPTHILSRIKYQIRSIYPDPQQNNIIWIGTNAGGLFKYDRQKSILKQYNHQVDNPSSLSHPFIHHIYRDRIGNLWISTFGGGLNRMNESEETFIHYKHNPSDINSINHDWVNVIFESSSGTLWVGTRGGLNKFDRQNNSFSHYTEQNGLAGNIVFGILEDDQGYLWLSTTNGLSRFNPAVQGINAFRNYDVGDGIHGNEFENKAYFQSKSGEIYFGGIRGFTIFHPDRIKDNPYIPNVVITDLKIYDQSLNPGNNSPLKQTISQTQQITLDYYQNSLTFEFAALDYLNPLKNKYVYKMEGIDHDWITTDASRRFATYTQLDPGDYNFRVKGSNSDGLWNEDGAWIRIIITPPWWRTNWAYFVYVLLLVFVLYALRTYDQKRQSLKHKLEMEHLHAEKLEEIDSMKSRFFTNISHEFRTPLTLILGPIQSLLTNIRDVGLKNELNMVLRNARRLKNLVNQLLDLSKLESGKMSLQVQKLDIIPLLRKLVIAFTSLAERNKISLNYRSTSKSLIAYIDSDKIEKIINNLLSNAFKFTPTGGKISVTINTVIPEEAGIHEKKRIPHSGKVIWDDNGDKKREFFEISVTNTGSAIPASKIAKIFERFYRMDESYTINHEGTGIGLSLVKELVELHHGTIRVESGDAGTIFTVKLPLNRNHYTEDEIIEIIPAKETIESKKLQEELPISGRFTDEIEKISRQEMYLILLIEDNVDMRKYISDNLQKCYRLIEAVDGHQGWDLVANKIPDIVISDIMMPGLDGFQLCEKIKSDMRTSHIPVILLTARAEMTDKIKGLETGADDYMPKPFDITELQVRIKNLIDQRHKLRKRFAMDILLKPHDIAVTSMDKKFINQALEIIEKEISNAAFNVDNFVREMGVSRAQLYNKLHALTGQSVKEFIRTIRLKRGAQLIRERYGSISEIAFNVGFNNPAYFSVCFRKQFGQTPSQYAHLKS